MYVYIYKYLVSVWHSLPMPLWICWFQDQIDYVTWFSFKCMRGHFWSFNLIFHQVFFFFKNFLTCPYFCSSFAYFFSSHLFMILPFLFSFILWKYIYIYIWLLVHLLKCWSMHKSCKNKRCPFLACSLSLSLSQLLIFVVDFTFLPTYFTN